MFSSRPQIIFKIRLDASQETILAKYHNFSNIKSLFKMQIPSLSIIMYKKRI